MTQQLLQTILTVLLVAACSLYAIWTLMPSALRRALARSLALSRLRLPGFVARRLLRVAVTSSGCGGCSHAPKHRGSGSAGCH